MCGIFAVSGESQNAGELILAGLKKLEYRGYDSWGICVRGNNDVVFIDKDIGKISEVKKKFIDGSEAIGHTRWATHGGVTKNNAHPHKIGKVTIVHNGIFENYLEVKRELSHYKFRSETDTEVVAACINDAIESGLKPLDAIRATAERIVGRFAICVIFDGEEGIYAARRGSPLIVGRGKKESYLASDIPAFLKQTNIVNYLDDNELVYIHKEKADFFGFGALCLGRRLRC